MNADSLRKQIIEVGQQVVQEMAQEAQNSEHEDKVALAEHAKKIASGEIQINVPEEILSGVSNQSIDNQ